MFLVYLNGIQFFKFRARSTLRYYLILETVGSNHFTTILQIFNYLSKLLKIIIIFNIPDNIHNSTH